MARNNIQDLVNGRVDENVSEVSSAVRYDRIQIRSDEEKALARANAGAIGAAELAETKADLETQIENISGISDPEAVSQMVEDVAKHEEDISALKSSFETLGNITPEMFGAKGDGITDDTEAVRSALEYVSTRESPSQLFLSGTYKITERIVVSGNGLFCVKGIDCNTSSIVCSGADAGITFYDSTKTMHELDLRDFQIRGDYTQTQSLLLFKNVFNIYLFRVYTVNAGVDNYGYSFEDSGIISCEECLVVGSNNVSDYAAYSNGVYVKNCASIFTFTGANFWNLDKAFVFEGTIGQINIQNNWIECVNSFVERNIYIGEDGRYSAFNIENNTINIHTYLNFIPSTINFVMINPDVNSVSFANSKVNFDHNTVYIASNENISIIGNSLVYIPKTVSSEGLINIYFDGNVFSGKTLNDLQAYVFSSAITSLYVNSVRIRSAKIIQRLDVQWITDDTRIISDVVPALFTNRSGISAPNGIYIGNSSSINNGRLFFDNGAFYAYINNVAYTFFNANTKLVKMKTQTGTTGTTGNIALETLVSAEKIISIVGDIDGVYTPFVSNGNNFVHVTTRSGDDIAGTAVSLTILYV